MRGFAWRSWTVLGVVAAVLLGGTYAMWATRDDASVSDAGWLSSLASVQGEWVSQTGFAYDGTEPWAGPVRLTVSDNQLRFHARCNHLSVTAGVSDHRLTAVHNIVSTAMGCSAELAAQDAWLAALVRDHATVQLHGPMLTFDTDAGWIGFAR